jgi:hypothetical protein
MMKHITEEHKRKISLALKGRKYKPMSAEGRLNISMAKKGKTTWNKGKTGIYSKETLKKISDAGKGRVVSEETKEKMRSRMLGNQYTLGHKFSNEHRQKLSAKKKGYSPTIEHRRNLSIANKGENAWNWKGGVSPINKQIHHSIDYKLWREAVYERDNWTCQKCGTTGGKLHPHHIKSFAEYPEMRFVVSNGITLCVNCHAEEHPTIGFFVKARAKEVIELIREG